MTITAPTLTDTQTPSFAGIHTITVSYDGGGDSGGIESVTAYSVAGDEVELTTVQQDLVEERVYELLPSGYENNEGGYGEVEISIGENQMSMSHHDRESTTESTTHQLDHACAGDLRRELGKRLVRELRSAGATEIRLVLSSCDSNRLRALDADGRMLPFFAESEDTSDTICRLADYLHEHFPVCADTSSDNEGWALCLSLRPDWRRSPSRRRHLRATRGEVVVEWTEESTQDWGEGAIFIPKNEESPVAP